MLLALGLSIYIQYKHSHIQSVGSPSVLCRARHKNESQSNKHFIVTITFASFFFFLLFSFATCLTTTHISIQCIYICIYDCVSWPCAFLAKHPTKLQAIYYAMVIQCILYSYRYVLYYIIYTDHAQLNKALRTLMRHQQQKKRARALSHTLDKPTIRTKKKKRVAKKYEKLCTFI